MSHHTLTKLTNGSYVLAHNNKFVLAYHSEADEYVTWAILDNDINKTHNGSYYSKIDDAIECYLERNITETNQSLLRLCLVRYLINIFMLTKGV